MPTEYRPLPRNYCRSLTRMAKISPEMAEETLNEVQQTVAGLEKKYTRGLRKYQFWLSEKDKDTLSDVRDVLILLGLHDVIKENAVRSDKPEENLKSKLYQLLERASNFESRYFSYHDNCF